LVVVPARLDQIQNQNQGRDQNRALGREWVDEVVAALGPDVVRVDVGDLDRAALAELVAGEFVGVVSLLGLDESCGVAGTASLVQALGDAGVAGTLWAVTCGAVSVSAADRVSSLGQAGVWGLGRVAALEYPQLWGGLVDLPAVLDQQAAERFVGVLAGAEDQVAVRAEGVYGRRLVSAAPAGVKRWEPSGTVLITGGTGALGARVARWLAGAGVQHLVLASRRGMDAPGAAELSAELVGLGAGVSVVACDVADRGAVAAVLDAIPAERALTGVVHTAGVLDDGVLEGLTPGRFEAVYRSKVASALVLDELTRDLDLSVFALFSSVAGSVGSAGQANYASANAVLDALALQRQSDGLAATSIAWAAWRDEGIAQDAAGLERSRRLGVAGLDPELAMSILRRVVVGAEATMVVADLQQPLVLTAFLDVRPSPLLGDLPEARRLAQAAEQRLSSALPGLAFGERLRALSRVRGLAVLVDLVRTHVAGVLGHVSAELMGEDRAFRELGVDSLTALEVRNGLVGVTGLSLPASLVFDYPTPGELAEHLLEQILPEGGSGAAVSDEETEVRAALASLSLAQLRKAGVLELLLQLGRRSTSDTSTSGGRSGESLDSMDLDDLIEAALKEKPDRPADEGIVA
jgi:NADP-dependent 3-hydroxy acid dehydrogenase YdfG/acyl carrier protein